MAYQKPNQAKQKDTSRVERVVSGPKGIWITADDGQRKLAEVGETVHVSARAAVTFKDRLKAPEVARAELAVAEATKAAAGDDDSEDVSE